jgi:uncharacterized pyridoxamine 5'-phosphate oxidase family protein
VGRKDNMKKSNNKFKLFGTLVTVGLSLFTVTQVAAWGPDNRATFTMEKPATYPTFNSITNNPTIGDERNFVRVGQINADVTDLTDEVEVIPGHQYLVYIYFHNNASSTFNDKAHNYSGVATKTRMSSSFSTILTPNERGKITATITAEETDPKSVWDEVRKIGGNNNYVLFNRHTNWTENGIIFTAVKAEHSDITPIGVIIDDGNKKYYVTGDTLYNKKVFKDLPSDIDVLFLPVNGVGNNMNMVDAAAFSDKVNAKYVVPLHFGLFDELDPRDFKAKNAIIPKFFEEIEI